MKQNRKEKKFSPFLQLNILGCKRRQGGKIQRVNSLKCLDARGYVEQLTGHSAFSTAAEDPCGAGLLDTEAEVNGKTDSELLHNSVNVLLPSYLFMSFYTDLQECEAELRNFNFCAKARIVL